MYDLEIPIPFIGIDEAGYGSIVGNAFGAACYVPNNILVRKALKNLNIRDSKKTTKEERRVLVEKINYYCKTKVISIPPSLMKKNGYAWLTKELLQAPLVELLKEHNDLLPATIIIDGNHKQLNYHNFPVKAHFLPKADNDFLSVACASILAKNAKDVEVEALHKKFPKYGFDSHSGYLTKKHREAIKEFGPCEEHRTFLKNFKK